MMLLSVDEILTLHTKLIAKTGGSDGLRDFGMLESAIYSTQAGFGDTDIYPTIEEKAARLMYALVGNHAFLDGNKRIGTYVMLVTLRLNNIVLSYSQQELIDLALAVAGQQLSYEEILAWIHHHKQKM